MFTPPEVVVITSCIAKYRKKVSLKPIPKILVKVAVKIAGRQQNCVSLSNE
jgi:hypothetical protein